MAVEKVPLTIAVVPDDGASGPHDGLLLSATIIEPRQNQTTINYIFPSTSYEKERKKNASITITTLLIMSNQFKPALIIVDLQEDFCPPNGSLAVQGGRALAPIINSLLSLPFTLKIATRDWHPPNHASFAVNHPGASPFTSTHTITHPDDGNRTYTTTLWPVHCLADSPGAQLIPELNASLVDAVVDKGQRVEREMYSAFYDPFGESDSGLARILKEAGVTHAFVVGVAFDYCVRATAEHAALEGFSTVVVGDATKAVKPEDWDLVVEDLKGKGIDVVSSDSAEVQRVKSLAS